MANVHPAPWRWVDDRLVDANGRVMLEQIGDSAYVRAVTERAGAMEQALRKAVEMVNWLRPFAMQFSAPGANLPTDVQVADAYLGGQELLAEIDAAKASG